MAETGWCNRCKSNLSMDCFGFHRQKRHNYKLYRNSYCKTCMNALAKLHAKKGDRLKAERRRRVLDKLKDYPCLDCGVKYPPYVMDFDHRPGEKKEFGIALSTSRSKAMRRLYEEISKCDLVCSNCHRIRTHLRRSNPRAVSALDSLP